MKKYLLLFIFFVVAGLSACKKSDTTAATAAAQAATDDAKIQAYIKANNINATKDASGLYYSVITPGTGPYPTSVSNVTVAYTGKTLDGNTFDTKPSNYFALNGEFFLIKVYFMLIEDVLSIWRVPRLRSCEKGPPMPPHYGESSLAAAWGKLARRRGSDT